MIWEFTVETIFAIPAFHATCQLGDEYRDYVGHSCHDFYSFSIMMMNEYRCRLIRSWTRGSPLDAAKEADDGYTAWRSLTGSNPMQRPRPQVRDRGWREMKKNRSSLWGLGHRRRVMSLPGHCRPLAESAPYLYADRFDGTGRSGRLVGKICLAWTRAAFLLSRVPTAPGISRPFGLAASSDQRLHRRHHGGIVGLLAWPTDQIMTAIVDILYSIPHAPRHFAHGRRRACSTSYPISALPTGSPWFAHRPAGQIRSLKQRRGMACRGCPLPRGTLIGISSRRHIWILNRQHYRHP